MSHKPRSPFTICLFKKEAEAAVCLGIDFSTVNVEALRNGRLHLRHGTGCVGGDITRNPVASVHYERPFIHSGLGRGDEVLVADPAGPGGVDEGVGVEY